MKATDYDPNKVATASSKASIGQRLVRMVVALAWLGAIVVAPVVWIVLRLEGTTYLLHRLATATNGVWLPVAVRANPWVSMEALAAGAILFIALFIVKKKTKFFSPSRKPKSSGLHGTGGWGTFDDLKEMALLPPKAMGQKDKAHEGVFVGGYIQKDPWWRGGQERMYYLRHNGPEHILAFAPTRSGKGVGLVLPTLLTWTHSAIVHDPKGEAWNLTSGFRGNKLGQKVYNFDPASTNTSAVAAFNPLAEIRLNTPFDVADAQNVATILVDPEGKGLKDHWDKTGQSLMSALILHCCYFAKREYGRDARFSDVAAFFSTPDSGAAQTPGMPAAQPGAEEPSNLDKKLMLMREYTHLGDKSHPMISQEAQSMLDKEEREQTSVASTVISYLTLYRDPLIAANTGRSDWSIADIMQGDRPATAYLVVRPSDADRLRPLIRLIATQIVRNLTNEMEFRDGRSVAHYKHRLLLMFDEFTALKKLTVIEEALAYMAGYGIKAYLIVQDIQQLESVYGKEETIISNCHIKVCYAPNKIATAEIISKMAGRQTIVHKAAKEKGKSDKGGGGGDQWSETSRDLITAEECMRLRGARKNAAGDISRPGDLLMFVAGFRPIYGTQVLYFQDPYLLARSKIPPPLLTYGEIGETQGYQPLEHDEADEANEDKWIGTDTSDELTVMLEALQNADELPVALVPTEQPRVDGTDSVEVDDEQLEAMIRQAEAEGVPLKRSLVGCREYAIAKVSTMVGEPNTAPISGVRQGLQQVDVAAA